MNVEWIREFTVFARYLNFSRAASMLNMTQPTLSGHIASLEKELGFELVLRGKTLELTSAGRKFYTEAERSLADFDSIVRDCRELAHSFQGSLRFLKPIRPGGFARPLSDLVAAFREHYPGIVAIDLPDPKHTISESIASGNVDLALVFNRDLAGLERGLRDKVGYLALPTDQTETYYLWIDQRNPLAKKDLLELDDLDGCRFMIPSSARYQILENWANAISARYGMTLACVHWPGTYDECARQIADNEVMILTSREMQSPAVATRTDRTVRPIDEDAIQLQPSLVYLLDNKNPALKKFIEYLND